MLGVVRILKSNDSPKEALCNKSICSQIVNRPKLRSSMNKTLPRYLQARLDELNQANVIEEVLLCQEADSIKAHFLRVKAEAV